jgi:hypothetical protein
MCLSCAHARRKATQVTLLGAGACSGIAGRGLVKKNTFVVTGFHARSDEASQWLVAVSANLIVCGGCGTSQLELFP